MVMEIPLTRGYVAFIDDADYDRATAAGSWHAFPSRYTVYARRNRPARITGSRGSIFLHNFLTGWERVDHADLDGLNNQRGNLRPVTASQNAHNARLQRNNQLGLRGVSWNKRDRVYSAKIRFEGRLIHLGSFRDPSQAAYAYDVAATRYFGEFARLNFPMENVS